MPFGGFEKVEKQKGGLCGISRDIRSHYEKQKDINRKEEEKSKHGIAWQFG